jgi:hypothetical protein
MNYDEIEKIKTETYKRIYGECNDDPENVS